MDASDFLPSTAISEPEKESIGQEFYGYRVPGSVSALSPEQPANQKSFVCPYPECAKEFTRKATLDDHIRGPCHSNIKPFRCEHCDKAFTRVNDLKRHKSERHAGKRFVCEKALPTGERWGCGKRFSRASTLKKHQKDCKSYTDPKVQPWSKVTWQSAQEGTLRHEAKTRLEDGKQSETWDHDADHYVCKLCRARRSKKQQASFITHLTDHLENVAYRAFRCDDCEASFASSEQLRSHSQACISLNCSLLDDGAGFRQFWGCGQSFSSKVDYKSHMKGLDGTSCDMWHYASDMALKESILNQLAHLGVDVILLMTQVKLTDWDLSAIRPDQQSTVLYQASRGTS